MRLSTANTFNASIANLQQRQQKLQDTQLQLTSGKKVALASDDPTGAARAERALVSIGRVDANQRALEASRNSMTLGEAALGDANELLQQMRETMVAAGNASYSDAERAGLANKIAGLRDQLLSIANRPDGSGGFLFSGQGSANPPSSIKTAASLTPAWPAISKPAIWTTSRSPSMASWPGCKRPRATAALRPLR